MATGCPHDRLRYRRSRAPVAAESDEPTAFVSLPRLSPLHRPDEQVLSIQVSRVFRSGVSFPDCRVRAFESARPKPNRFAAGRPSSRTHREIRTPTYEGRDDGDRATMAVDRPTC